MVVKASPSLPTGLDLGYLSLFLGLRVNQLVMERIRAGDFQQVRESHGYLIQHLIESDRTITELARRMEVTQQAASKAVAELVTLGVLDLIGGSDRREKTVRLSKRGWTLVRLGRRVRCGIERRLISVAGREEYGRAKSVLTACLHALGGTERIRSRRVLPPQ
jgi:DNA-binding MarR family transcriptional regulator